MTGIDVLVEEFRQLDDAERTAFWLKSHRVRELRDMLGREFPEFRAEQLGLSPSAASKMLTVADNIPMNAEIPDGIHGTYLYYIARAVRDGHGNVTDLMAEAVNMPQHDFVEQYGFVKERRKEACTCPTCGREHRRLE